MQRLPGKPLLIRKHWGCRRASQCWPLMLACSVAFLAISFPSFGQMAVLSRLSLDPGVPWMVSLLFHMLIRCWGGPCGKRQACFSVELLCSPLCFDDQAIQQLFHAFLPQGLLFVALSNSKTCGRITQRLAKLMGSTIAALWKHPMVGLTASSATLFSCTSTSGLQMPNQLRCWISKILFNRIRVPVHRNQHRNRALTHLIMGTTCNRLPMLSIRK